MLIQDQFTIQIETLSIQDFEQSKTFFIIDVNFLQILNNPSTNASFFNMDPLDSNSLKIFFVQISLEIS